jgi:hypothetical protein
MSHFDLVMFGGVFCVMPLVIFWRLRHTSSWFVRYGMIALCITFIVLGILAPIYSW